MNHEDAMKILEVTLAHAQGYRDSSTQSDDLHALEVAEKCAIAASNTGWQILRSFGFSTKQIAEMRTQLNANASH